MKLPTDLVLILFCLFSGSWTLQSSLNPELQFGLQQGMLYKGGDASGFDNTSEMEEIYEESSYFLNADTLSESQDNPQDYENAWETSSSSKRSYQNDNHRGPQVSSRYLKVNYESIRDTKYLKITKKSNDGVLVETNKTRQHQKTLRQVNYEDGRIGRSKQDQWGSSNLSSEFKQINSSGVFCPKDLKRAVRGSKTMQLDDSCFVLDNKFTVHSDNRNLNDEVHIQMSWDLTSELKKTDEESIYRTKQFELVTETQTPDHSVSLVKRINEKSSYYPKAMEVTSSAPRSAKVDSNRSSGKWELTSDSQQSLVCLAKKQSQIEQECHKNAIHWNETWTTRNLGNCLNCFKNITFNREFMKEKELNVKEHCQAIQKKQVGELYSDCIITTSGALNESMEEVDLKFFSDIFIVTSKLTHGQKKAAQKKFDACLAIEYSQPDTIRINSLTSALSKIIVDCMKTALLKNGCTKIAANDV